MRNILTDAELAEIRAQLARRDRNVGGGYTWDTIKALLDTIDALRSPSPMPSAEPPKMQVVKLGKVRVNPPIVRATFAQDRRSPLKRATLENCESYISCVDNNSISHMEALWTSSDMGKRRSVTGLRTKHAVGSGRVSAARVASGAPAATSAAASLRRGVCVTASPAASGSSRMTAMSRRWTVTQEPPLMIGGVTRYRVRKGWDDALVDYTGGTFYCLECTPMMGAELTACRHANAARRAVASGRISDV